MPFEKDLDDVGFTSQVPGGHLYFRCWWKPLLSLRVRCLALFRRSLQACVRLQFVRSSHLLSRFYSTLDFGEHYLLRFEIDSMDLTSPSHYMIYSSGAEMIYFDKISLQNTLQLITVKRELSLARVFDVAAYRVQIRLLVTHLTQTGGLVLQVEEGNMSAACAIVPKTQPDVTYGIIRLPGPCGNADLYSSGYMHIEILQPYPNKHCCRLEGSIGYTQATHEYLLRFGFLESLYHPVTNVWRLPADNVTVELNVVCQHRCRGIFFIISSITYHSHL